ncbi:cupin domain-containing protein [Jiangella anatolica]|uniref:Cupin n=1 Tax=Jiangella anatolica TaxID=2670374 RepID=A0A2W2BTM7_9ACTN|nr:cupin domain-containing protein [Jiangella anatolica]PZF83368.1 cupin [Jiangella anatolica]
MDIEQGCRIVRGGGSFDGKQGLSYTGGVSAESVGAEGLCLHTLVIPPGGRGQAHLHSGHESAIYIVSGSSEVWSGPGLTQHDSVAAGDFVYIPAGVPHLPANSSGSEPLVCVIARTDPNEQESVVLLDDQGRPVDAEHP